ncbi:LysR family transcriptional regulator [Allosphingosinicella deserti]|uniref:LysR family transcriptional regulator n=1 Tax=Allosphingosinicella deserti TaxID=2116704 RepID=A0A2P7QY54_9SPHN|nr:LysR family transcriptional regulator [Sphingomonas deserti]PSJ42898.1 LysR family transcriptional regulator [Sphingomonas deserti]
MRGSQFVQLQALAAIVEAGSFSRAAAQLQISKSALSQLIRALEDQLGVLLLNRTTRSVAPTEAGQRLLDRFTPVMEELQRALDEARSAGSTPAGVLRIHAQKLGYDRYLKPIIGLFCSEYPAIVLDITIDDAPIDIVAEGFDAGIRLGELLDQDMIAVRLGAEMRQIAVAAPSYVAEHGVPAHPRDLLGHRCISFRWPGQDAIYSWEFAEGDSWFSVAVPSILVINDQRATIDAAVDGAGIAFWVESEVEALIEAGKLVPLLEAWSKPFPGFYLYFPALKQRAPALKAFTSFLRTHAR